jgi:hypothetical protein
MPPSLQHPCAGMPSHGGIQRDIRCPHHSLKHVLLHSSLQGRHSTQLVEHDHERVALDMIFVYPLYLYKRLGGDHEQLLKRGMRHRPLISLGKRERANRVQRDILVDCRLTHRHRKAPCPELPLDLRNHLCSRVTVLLLLRPLFGNESGRTCVGLGVYGPVLPLVLPRDLLLMQCFSRLPGQRWKSGHPGCRQDGDSRRNSDRSKRWPPHVCRSRQGN